MALNVRMAGATGWAGSELERSMTRAADLALVAAVARSAHSVVNLQWVAKAAPG